MTELDPRQQIQRDMVEALLRSTAMNANEGRQLFLDRLSDWLGGPLTVRVQSTVRLQIIELVRTCLKRPGGVAALVEVAAEFDPTSPETVRLQLLREEWEAITNFPPEDWLILRDTLTSLVVPDLREVCRAATGSRVSTLPPYCRTPWDAFVYLVGANCAAGMLPPWMAFLDYVAQWMDHDVAREIRARNQHLAGGWGLSSQLDAARWSMTELRAEAAAAYLVIQLEPDPVDPDRYTLSYWHQWDPYRWRPDRGEDRVVDRSELERAVEDVVADMEAAWGDRAGAVTVEFVLPWELLNSPVEWWPKDSTVDPPVPLTRDYPVVVRSLDRLRGRPWHRVWHQRWQQLERTPAASYTYWSRPSGADYLSRLSADLRGDDRIVSLVLSQPPQPDSPLGRQELRTALRFGLPVIIWHRADCTTPAFRQSVADLLADGGLAHLPGRARELRLEALGLDPESQQDHIGRHLSVLWDDPRRQPRAAEADGVDGGRS